MKRRTCTIAGIVLLAPLLAVAAPATGRPKKARGPAPDAAAIRDATKGQNERHRYVPASGVAHYLNARLATSAGAVDVAIRELKLAAMYDQQSPFVRSELGEAYVRLGDRKRAEAAAKDALTLDDRHLPALLLLGRLALEAGRVEIAVDWLRRATHEDPTRLDAAIDLARAYLAAGEWDAARLQADRVDVIASLADEETASDPMRQHDAGALMDEVADALAARGLDADAELLYRRGAERDPTWPDRLRPWATYLESRGRFTEAAVLHGRAYALAYNDPADASNAALARLKSGDPDAAAVWVAPLLSSVADDARVAASLLAIAWKLLDSGRPGPARTAFEEARRRQPARVDATFGSALAAEQAGELAAAVSTYALVPLDHSLGPRAAERAASCEEKLGQGSKAIERLQQTLALAPAAREPTLLLATLLERSGRRAEADHLRFELLARYPHPAAALGIAQAMVARGDRDEALSFLAEQSTRFADVNLELLRIQLLDESGAATDALQAARALVARHPGSAGAANQLAWMLAVVTEAGQGEGLLAEAEKHARAAVLSDPANTAFLDTLGYVLLLRGHDAAALEFLRRAAVGGDPGVLLHLGEALRRTGAIDEARAAWQRGLAAATGPANLVIRRRLETALGLP